jgi:formylglycine-generating enzyme required for sulfatase activity
MLPIQRRYVALFAGERWTPLVPAGVPNVYATLWEGEGIRLWTLVNRAEDPARGTLLEIELRSGERVFDLVAGRAVTLGAERMVIEGAMAPRGIGCFVAGAPAALGGDFDEFLDAQRASNARADWNTTFPALTAVLRPAPRTTAFATPADLPSDMVAIPAASFTTKVTFRTRECGFYASSPDGGGGPGGSGLHQPFTIERAVALDAYAMDLTPVTNAAYAAFLKATGYRPRHPENFLKHWRDGAPPPGLEEHPVVYVDLDDARAYARWAGKRLPTEEEWQYAAAGPDARRYPWGNELLPGRANGGESGGTTPVKAFPEGRSSFGCYDMCGNVWEWTESERSDGRTRFAILRGGSYYQARGSGWYMDGGPQPADFACKVLLFWPGLDRCATVGFRCAADGRGGAQ